MRSLLPVPAESVDLVQAYAYPDGRVWLRANMVASLDGAASSAGLSEGLSGPADKRVFFALRGLADLVLVGAGTVRAEGYGPARPRKEFAELRAAAGQDPAPVIAVVSRRLDLDYDSKLFTEPVRRTIVVTVADADPDRLEQARKAADVITAGTGHVDLDAALDALAERGYRRMLTEGGPRLLDQLLLAGRLDELCLTLSPRLLGGETGLRILVGPAASPPAQLRLAGLCEEDGFLFARYVTGTED